MTVIRAKGRGQRARQWGPLTLCALIILLALCGVVAAADLPRLDQPVNDFAHVVDADSARRMDAMSRSLQAKTGDAVVVATVPNLDPYGDVNEYAVKLFENRGRGVGSKGKDNGVLILLAPAAIFNAL